MNSRSVLVAPEAALAGAGEGLGLYARVSSHDQGAGLGRQVTRLAAWAAEAGQPVARIEAEVGSGVYGARAKARRLLADPKAGTVVAGRRVRLGRVNSELAGAALSASGRRLVVLDPAELADGLVRDMTEVLTSLCARLYGRASARNRAGKAVRCAARDTGPAGVSG